jgi:hypothetical protein
MPIAWHNSTHRGLTNQDLPQSFRRIVCTPLGVLAIFDRGLHSIRF